MSFEWGKNIWLQKGSSSFRRVTGAVQKVTDREKSILRINRFRKIFSTTTSTAQECLAIY